MVVRTLRVRVWKRAVCFLYVCEHYAQGWDLSVFAFSYLNRLTALAFSYSPVHTWACTHAHTHSHICTLTKSQEGRHNAVFPPPFSEDVFFFFVLSPRLPGRGTLPFVSKCTLSLSFPLLFSVSLIHCAQRAREREKRSLSPGQEEM